MNSTRAKIFASLTLTAALVLSLASIGTKALAATNQESQKLEKTIAPGKRLDGTWRVQVSIRDCGSGAVLRTFPAMLTFAQGGTLTETTTGFPPTVRSPGHGVWSFLGDHSYTGISEAFLFSPAGVWIGTQRLTQAIEIEPDGNQLNSTATNEIFDVFGNLTTSGCATAVATRFE